MSLLVNISCSYKCTSMKTKAARGHLGPKTNAEMQSFLAPTGGDKLPIYTLYTKGREVLLVKMAQKKGTLLLCFLNTTVCASLLELKMENCDFLPYPIANGGHIVGYVVAS